MLPIIIAKLAMIYNNMFIFLTSGENLLVLEVLFERDTARHYSGELCIVHNVAAGIRSEVLFYTFFSNNISDAGGIHNRFHRQACYQLFYNNAEIFFII